MLQRALAEHVRTPLRTWPTVGAEWKRSGEYPWHYAKKGQLAANDDLLTALSHTLLYSCMHLDALCEFMQRSDFRVPLARGLATRGTGDSVASDPSVLHVDFGCGPGTASWAVTNALAASARITTVGHDHNQHMTSLADKITRDLAAYDSNLDFCGFHPTRTGFEREVETLAKQRWNTVIVTANSVFGQASSITCTRVVELITKISGRTGEVPLFVAGTHPPYSEVQVRDCWQRIASLPGTDMLYAGVVSIVTGAPRRYDPPSWVEWRPQPQMAHLVRIVGARA